MKSGTAHTAALVSILFLFILGCAKVNTPSGGPKDKEPPVVTGTVPANGARNFKGKELIISFNEFVILDNITQKFMVSPPLARKPLVVTRGKGVRVTFDDKLRDSTTYTFYFQDAIRDLNEGNPINNYQFVFSTGPFLDSLSVTGNIATGLTLAPPENTLVLMYRNLADSFVVKHLPEYITRVESNGDFRIDNVRPGWYRLYALKDLDNSKTYNNRDEEFAFYPDTISVTPAKNSLPPRPVVKDTVRVPVGGKALLKQPVPGMYQMILFQAPKIKHFLAGSERKMPYQLTYILSLPPDSGKFNFSIPGATPGDYFIQDSQNKDTITVWLTDSTFYNQSQLLTLINYPFTDSLGVTRTKLDSVTLRYIAPKAPRSKAAKKNPFKVINGILSTQVRPDMRISFIAPTPMQPPDTSRIGFYELEKDVKKERVPFSLSKDSLNACRFNMRAILKPGKSYLLITDKGAFRSIYGEVSDSTGSRFMVASLDKYGDLTLNIKNFGTGGIIQLLDHAEKIVRQVDVKGDGKLSFHLLEKGFYRIRAIYDLNGDGKWTTGDFDLHREPEPVSYYPSEIEIKENWEITQPWDLTVRNFKDFELIQPKKTEQPGSPGMKRNQGGNFNN
jgi:hypothetical protein